jgi:hypothetical protein
MVVPSLYAIHCCLFVCVTFFYVSCEHRDKWNSFKGFPKDGAALCYIYLVEKTKDALNPSAKAAPSGTGVTVSTLEKYAKCFTLA